MKQSLFPECEYCYLDKIMIIKNSEVVDDDGNKCYKVKIVCYFELKDANKNRLSDKPDVVKTEYVHPTAEMITDAELWNILPSTIKPAIDRIIADAKLEYANYIQKNQ